jgi:hypothetical protein
MGRWSEVETEAGELAARAKVLFDAQAHKTLATIRRDGAPRISGIECFFIEGELWLGSMHRAMKALDLLRDPRFALHSASIATDWAGDAKVAGRIEEITDPAVIARVVPNAPPGPLHLFRANIQELVLIWVDQAKAKMIVESWHEGRGLARAER